MEKKSKRYMLPHPHRDRSNMESCMACVEKLVSHILTGAEGQAKQRTDCRKQAVLWHRENRHSHIKGEKPVDLPISGGSL